MGGGDILSNGRVSGVAEKLPLAWLVVVGVEVGIGWGVLSC